MQKPATEIVLARTVDGRTEEVEWIRQGDTVWTVTESDEIVIRPKAWKQAWADLVARGFVEVSPNDQLSMNAEIDRVLDVVRSAFCGVTLGNGVGLRQGQGLDDYADKRTLASYRAQDESMTGRLFRLPTSTDARVVRVARTCRVETMVLDCESGFAGHNSNLDAL